MILIVNLNLAVDHIIELNELRPGQVQRSRGTRRQAGGKGVNVARVLKTLGEMSLLTGFLGGSAGELIADGLRAEQLASALTHMQNESRTCLILNDQSRGEQTVINEPGPAIGVEELSEFNAHYSRALADAELVVITGSLPPNLPEDTYARLIDTAHEGGKRVLLDCSSAPLRRALGARPFLVKVNQPEAAELLRDPITDFESAARAAHRLCESGAANAMITLGKMGAALNFAGGEYRLTAPHLASAVNSVGSGDAAMAGLAAGLRRGWTAEQTGVLAVAAGAANALHGAGHCHAEEISQLQAQVTCTRRRPRN